MNFFFNFIKKNDKYNVEQYEEGLCEPLANTLLMWKFPNEFQSVTADILLNIAFLSEDEMKK